MTSSYDLGSFSLSGNRYRELNQDCVMIKRLSSSVGKVAEEVELGCIAAVLDGHGLLGERAASRAGDAVVQCLCDGPLSQYQLSSLAQQEVEQMMWDAFLQGHQAALAIYDNPPATLTYPDDFRNTATFAIDQMNGLTSYQSGGKSGCQRLLECGSTCTVAVLQSGWLCVANVGDSTAVLGSWDQSCGRIGAEVITTQHCGSNPCEAQRIKEQYAHMAEIIVDDGYLRMNKEPWVGYELSVTRSLGHKHLWAYGVVPDPTVKSVELKPEHCCLVIASDGLWDVLSPREAVDRVLDGLYDGQSAQEVAECLVRDAVELGETNPSQDNTSAIVVAWQ